MTFTAQQVICALIFGLAVGAVAGAVAMYVLVVARIRRDRDTAERRRRAQTIRADTQSIRADAFALLLRTVSAHPTIFGHRVLDDNDQHSRRVPPLEVVK